MPPGYSPSVVYHPEVPPFPDLLGPALFLWDRCKFLPQPAHLGSLSLLGPPSAGFLRDMHRGCTQDA